MAQPRRADMLVQQTIDKLEAIGMNAMATALREQVENSTNYLELSFEDRLGLLVDRESDWRDNRRLASRLKAAKLRHAATVEDIDFRSQRGIDRGVVLSLAQGSWVHNHHNLLITGATGCGKSYLCCALAHAAIRQGHTALYVRTPRLLDDLAVSHGDGRYATLLRQLQRVSLLVLDDFLLTPATVAQCRDLLEVIEDRAQLRSTLVASQLPVESWHGAMADPTLAEAILDRLLHRSHRLTVKGPSMRKRDPEDSPNHPPPAPTRPRSRSTR
jgi:DNA replication protein DnaC